MTVQLEQPLWQEDEIRISNCRLIENPAFVPPGSVEIRWDGAGGEHYLIMRGNPADDFMERYRASADDDARQNVMLGEIRRVAA